MVSPVRAARRWQKPAKLDHLSGWNVLEIDPDVFSSDARNSGYSAITLTTFRDLPWNGPFYARLGFEEVTALDAHPRLAGELALEADHGLPVERRCAMIHFLN